MRSTGSRAKTTTRLTGLPPVADEHAELLILGTMPGPLSLAMQQYYAHPRNGFWPIVGRLFGFDAAAPYESRLESLRVNRIALWDVLRTCHRDGASDAAIRDGAANDFAGFFSTHRRIRSIAFNGREAARLFERLIGVAQTPVTLEVIRLPSTSPANASQSMDEKLQAWASLRACVQR